MAKKTKLSKKVVIRSLNDKYDLEKQEKALRYCIKQIIKTPEQILNSKELLVYGDSIDKEIFNRTLCEQAMQLEKENYQRFFSFVSELQRPELYISYALRSTQDSDLIELCRQKLSYRHDTADEIEVVKAWLIRAGTVEQYISDLEKRIFLHSNDYTLWKEIIDYMYNGNEKTFSACLLAINAMSKSTNSLNFAPILAFLNFRLSDDRIKDKAPYIKAFTKAVNLFNKKDIWKRDPINEVLTFLKKDYLDDAAKLKLMNLILKSLGNEQQSQIELDPLIKYFQEMVLTNKKFIVALNILKSIKICTNSVGTLLYCFQEFYTGVRRTYKSNGPTFTYANYFISMATEGSNHFSEAEMEKCYSMIGYIKEYNLLLEKDWDKKLVSKITLSRAARIQDIDTILTFAEKYPQYLPETIGMIEFSSKNVDEGLIYSLRNNLESCKTAEQKAFYFSAFERILECQISEKKKFLIDTEVANKHKLTKAQWEMYPYLRMANDRAQKRKKLLAMFN